MDSKTSSKLFIWYRIYDGKASILRITQDCEVLDGKGIVGNEHSLNKYYDCGIKNSLGMHLIL